MHIFQTHIIRSTSLFAASIWVCLKYKKNNKKTTEKITFDDIPFSSKSIHNTICRGGW